MIRALFTAALLSLAAALPARAIDIQQVTSPGGVPAWLVEDHSIPFVALNIAFRGGASVDAPGKRGAVNLMTALLEEGAGERDATAYAEALESLGATTSFGAGDDAVTVSLRALTENRDEAADLLHDALTTPRFDADAVERVRAQVQSVIRSEATDPQSIAAKEMARRAWGDHPYGSSLNGTAESVAALTADDLRAAKDRVLARDRVIVSAAGDIDAAALGALIDRILGDLPAQATAPLPPPAQLKLTGETTVIDWDSPQTVVSFAQAGLPMSDPDYFAAFVLDHILGGGGFSSRLMDEIREKRGLTYGVGTGLANKVLGETWQGGMATANDKTAQAVALVREVVGQIREGVTDKELADAKTYLTGEYPLRFDGNGKIAGILTGMQLMGMPRDYVNTRNGMIEKVTAADVKRVADRLLDPAKLEFVLVGRPVGL
ncbi:M16 family metallopeptidase [Paracoccus sphaerophysae]|uniref:Zinc protease n=1 Tax=Paracoccus sphaerophysae TaxID=690417 RepID=A0A099FGR0_9RHOB|nr:pitrilysin family protein [Paracoccus sphaerophysae]KGJ09421.1 zinc protease [Paracoccus sphaerophysae]